MSENKGFTIIQNKIKNSMKDVEVLNFGKDGKIFWTNSKTGSRIFRNKII